MFTVYRICRYLSTEDNTSCMCQSILLSHNKKPNPYTPVNVSLWDGTRLSVSFVATDSDMYVLGLWIYCPSVSLGITWKREPPPYHTIYILNRPPRHGQKCHSGTSFVGQVLQFLPGSWESKERKFMATVPSILAQQMGNFGSKPSFMTSEAGTKLQPYARSKMI